MTTYEIKELTTKAVPVAPAGMRSVRLGWKDTKTSKALSSTKYVHISALTCGAFGISDNLTDNQSKEERNYILSLLYAAQDKFIHGLVSGWIEDGKPYSHISDEDISLDVLVKDNLASGRGQGKLSKSTIEEWFKNDLYEVLALKVLEQTGMDEAKTETILANYLGYFQKLASPLFYFGIPLATKLHETILLCPNTESSVYKNLEKKLADMKTEKTMEDLGL